MDPQAIVERLRNVANIPAAFFALAEDAPNETVYLQSKISDQTIVKSSAPRRWSGTTYQQAAAQISRLSHYLSANGIGRGSRVAIVSYTRPEWLLADLAILAAGGVSVSIYHSVNRDETGYILFDSEASVAFAENQEQVSKLLSLSEIPCQLPGTELRSAAEQKITLKKIIAFELVSPHPLVVQLSDILADRTVSDTTPASFLAVTGGDLASLVYTSGTTGPPKGVMQTHTNHLTNVWQAARTNLFALDGDLFLFLPLAHSFARLIGYIGFLTPTRLKFPAVADTRSSILNVNSVLQDLRESGVQVVPTVPRILEKMVAGIKERSSAGGLSGFLLGATLRSARNIWQAERDGYPANVGSQILYFLTSPLRRKIKRQLFGSGFQHGVSGGAKLPIPINEFLASLSIVVYEGYGLTETCVATNVNRRELNKIGSVGPCLEGIELKISEEGEILFRGPNVALGYFNRPQATKEAWDSAGWFHTGDLGYLDSDQYLFITGRKKELIVTAGGKKIAPVAIEERLVASRFIASATVFGDGKPYCVALIQPELPVLEEWSRREGRPVDLTSRAVLELFQQEIEAVNERLSKFETIKRFRLINDEFTVENGMLTPTFKVKRTKVQQRYEELIESMYL